MNNFIKVALHSYIYVHSFLIGWFNYRAMGNVYLSALQKNRQNKLADYHRCTFCIKLLFFSFSRALIKLIHRPIKRATLIDDINNQQSIHVNTNLLHALIWLVSIGIHRKVLYHGLIILRDANIQPLRSPACSGQVFTGFW